MGETIKITPIYGWGWHDSQTKWVDVPGPFLLDISSKDEGKPSNLILGFVTAPGHLLSNRWILLLLRHSDGNTRSYTLYAFDEKPDTSNGPNAPPKPPPILTGFAMTAQ